MLATAQDTQTNTNVKASVWRSLATLPQPQHGLSATESLAGSALTEVFYQAEGLKQLLLLVPVLAQLSREKRWVTFIAPPCLPNGRALARAGVDTRKIQVIHTGTIRDYWKTLDDVLKNGQSSAVLCWPPHGEYNDAKRALIKHTAESQKTATFVFRAFGKTGTESINDSGKTKTEADAKQLRLAF